VNQNQKRDYIRKQLRKYTSSTYEKSTRFLQLAAKLRRWTACEGLYLQKKNCVYQALSLSSTGGESERRGRGELDPDRVQPPDCHFWRANAFRTRPGRGISMPFLTILFSAIFICNRYIHFDLFQIYLILIFYDRRSIFKRTRLVAAPFQPGI